MSARQIRIRAGFTLIETIIALTLTSVLMLLVWSTFDIYTKYETKGVDAAEQTALLRALHSQFREDLLHVVVVDPRRPVPSDTIETSATAVSALNAVTNVAAGPENGYLIGTATDLHFLRFVVPEVQAISLPLVPPVSTSDASSSSTAPAREPWVRVVSYEPRLLRDADTAQSDGFSQSGGFYQDKDLPADDARQLDPLGQSSLDTQLEPTPLGIERRVRVWREYLNARSVSEQLGAIISTSPLAIGADDLMSVGPTGSQSDPLEQQLLKPKEIVDEIPEVRRLTFRYFDGASWMSEWNSTLSGHLPVAIEVSLDLKMDYDAPSTTADRTAVFERTPGDTPESETASTLEVGSLGSGSPTSAALGGALPLWTTDYRWLVAVGEARPTAPIPPPSEQAGSSDESISSPEPFLPEGLE